MKAIISKTELVSLIGKIQGVITPNPAIPILANILIEAVDDQLIISATDLTVSMRAFAEAKVTEEGSITLPARKFFQLVRELTAPQIELHCASPEVAFLNAGTSHFKLQGMHKSEFPTFPDLSDGTQFKMNNGALKEMLTRTSFAAAKDDSRQILNGIMISQSDHKATFIGTDGKRLAKLHFESDTVPDGLGSHVVPLKAVDEMTKILGERDEKSTLTITNDKLALTSGSITLITKLLSGQYPDVDRVIPQISSHPVTLHREELMSLLRQVSLFTSDNNHSVRFSFTPGELHLSAMSGDIGEGKVSMPVNYAGEKLEIAFNPHYFLDILKHSRDETVNFSISDAFNPGLITDSSNAQFVIMPMRIEG